MAEGHTFGQRRPPLSVTITSILSRYPDGQIFKELIQNADDAGARVVRFYLDDRQHGQNSLVRPEVARFQGPALLAYNDAQFTDQDWEGIQSLQMSNKAEDAFKVGKFGIGFNSVYHITDFPIIVSGDRMAFLEPQEEVWRGESGKYFTLSEVIPNLDTVAPFVGLCGFSQHLTTFSGTIFRFPLRNCASGLSEQLYNMEKLNALLDALKCEGKNLLLFLRSVDTVEVYEINSRGQQTMKFKTCVHSEERETVYSKRMEFLERVRQEYNANGYRIRTCIPLTLDFRITVVDGVATENHQWVVVSQVGSTSEEVLEHASRYHLLPWVGAATEEGVESQDKRGRVFCFLPMPMEASSPLPIYVNGTFGLNDDRRTLKWQSSERQNDVAAKWNKFLVTEVVPSCYSLLIRYAIDDLRMPYREVYSIWPNLAAVKGTKWEPLLSTLFRSLAQRERIVWTTFPREKSSSSAEEGEWISISRATFLSENERGLSELTQVHASLYYCGVKLVEIPAPVHRAFQCINCAVNYLTQGFVKKKLKANHGCYQNADTVGKVELLMYCVSDKRYETLIGLQLLPLANNTFTTFRQRNFGSPQPIYVCDTASYPKELFPNKDHLFVSFLSAEVLAELTKVASSNMTQVQLMDFPSAVHLIRQCFPSKWQQCQQALVSNIDPSFPASWFSTFWRWIQPHDLSQFADEMVFPLSRDFMSCTDSFEVARLSSRSPVLYLSSNDTYSCLLPALNKLPLKITNTQAHPHLVHRQLGDYVKRLTPKGILEALSSSCGSQLSRLQGVSFNGDEANQLCVLLSQLPQVSPSSYEVLINLPIFLSLNCSSLCNVLTSAQASWGKKAVIQPQEFPLDVKHLSENLVIFQPLPYQLPLLKLLTNHVRAPTVMEFVLDILLPMVSQNAYKPLSNMDAIMSEIVLRIPTWKWYYPGHIPSLLKSLSELPFLPVDGNVSSQRRRPKELYNLSNAELEQLFQGELAFPSKPFNEQSHLASLKDCGLMSEVTPKALLNIITSIGLTPYTFPQPVDAVKYSRAKAVLSYISNHPLPNDAQLAQVSKSCCWLPVRSTLPIGYPPCLKWKGTHCISHFASSNVFVPSVETSDLQMILGSQMFIADACVPHRLSTALNSAPSLTPMVVAHFQEVIAHHADIAPAHLEKMVHLIYQYLSKQADAGTLLQELPQWVYVKGKFLSPEVVAIEANDSFSPDLSPYMYTIPESLASQHIDLFTRCGIQRSLTRRQICSVLKMMHGSGGCEVSPKRAWDIVVSILNWLTNNGEQMAELEEGETLYVPIECDSSVPKLEDFTKVTYSDNEFLCTALSGDGQDAQYTFLNHRVTSLAHCLHISPLSDHLSITEDAFEDAGQHEPLTVRLKNILKEYKDGLTIVKEMLQNADDAGATELNICYDGRTHNTERSKLFFPDMADAHGPALLIHNNKTFTDDDFRNITKLAGATKGQPLKIGKFGVGFCSVYHITDVPSFISREYLHIFDPTLKYLKGAVKDTARPGKKISLSHPIFRSSKQLQPYQGLFGFDNQKSYSGTIFRLPFREAPSEISSTMYNKYTIDEMICELEECSSEVILFLRHITKITFSSIESGSSVPVVLMEIEKSSQQWGEKSSVVTITIRKNGVSIPSRTWLVSFSEENVSGKQGIGSVACLLEICDGRFSVQRCKGEVFCFLPLSNATGFHVHISANFAVMTNRRGIWAEDNHTAHSTTESRWNVSLMKTVIPKAYYSMLVALKEMEQKGKLSSYSFHSLWPLEKDLEQQHPWTACIATLYKMIAAGELVYSKVTSKWLTIKDSRFIAPAIFAVSSAHSNTPPCIVQAIEGLNIPVVDLPFEYRHRELQLGKLMINEQVFLELFFKGIDNLQHMQECRNAVLETLLEAFAVEIRKGTEREKTLKSALEKQSCVPCSPNGAVVKKCCELIDPRSEFAAMYNDADSIFPTDSIHRSRLAMQAMLELGLHHDSVPWEFVIERAKAISSLYKVDSGRAMKRVECILQSIQKNLHLCSGGKAPEKARELSSVPFLPVKQKPKGYPLPWFGDNCPPLLCGEDLVAHVESHTNDNLDLLVGSSAAILKQNSSDRSALPKEVCNLLELKTTPTCLAVATHLKNLVVAVQSSSPSKSSIQKLCSAVYTYLEHYLNSDAQPNMALIEELKALKCIWTGQVFVYPSMIAKQWALDGPYLFKIPHLIDGKEKLIEHFGIQPHFAISEILKALCEMGNDFQNEPISVACQKVIHHAMTVLLEENIDTTQSVVLPDQGYVMCNADQLAYNDTAWCEADRGTRYLHDSIPRPLALKLGVKTVRNLIVEKYASLLEYSDTEGGFGQNEPLTRRIQNILQDYPRDETILKELLQNADDAKANKMYVILDKRTHGDKTFSDEWKDLQGPALLIWNDSIFSPNDLKGIQKLGLGSKRSDPETIGQYGVGFNVVYHLTDCPTFISNGDTMCIFDPHCKYAPGATASKPGALFRGLNDEFWQKFPDLKSSYLREGIGECPQDLQEELKGGSLFRFPLRHNQNIVGASKIVPDEPDGSKPFPLDARRMQALLDNWAPHMKQSMFFLNNVTEIKFFVIEEGFHHLELTHHFSTCVEQAERRKLVEFKECVNKFTEDSEPKTVLYTLSLSEKQIEPGRRKKTAERWLIQQGIGDISEKIHSWSYIKQMKPKHGIAAPLDANNSVDGQVYCFLPLPIMSHLPVHINGHFVLNTARRDLWKPTNPGGENSDPNTANADPNGVNADGVNADPNGENADGVNADPNGVNADGVNADPNGVNADDPRIVWNRNLLSAISASYHKLLKDMRHHIIRKGDYSINDRTKCNLRHYYSLFPKTKPNLEKVWLNFANDVYKRLIHDNTCILAVVKHEESHTLLPADDEDDATMEEPAAKLVVKWFPLQSAQGNEQAHLFELDQYCSLYSSHYPRHQQSATLAINVERTDEVVVSVTSTAIVPANGGQLECPIPELYQKNSGPLSIEAGPASHHTAVSAKVDENESDIRTILEMVGMVIACDEAHSIKQCLRKCGFKVPTTTSDRVFKYYRQYYNQVLPHGAKFPLDIRDTKFKTTANFKKFLCYILNKSPISGSIFAGMVIAAEEGEGEKILFPEGVPLLLTADQKIRKFNKKNPVLSSEYSDLFPRSSHKFLHPELLCFDMVTEYFLSSTENENDETFYNQNLHEILCGLFPEELMNEQAERELMGDDEVLKRIWECLTEDSVFCSCLSIIVKRWALLPSCKKLFSSASPVLPMVPPSDESPHAHVASLLLSLEMPFLEKWVPTAANQFCPQLEQPSKVLLNLVNFYKQSKSAISKDSIKVIFQYFRTINFTEESASVGLIRCLPCFQDIFGNLTDLNGKTAYYIPTSCPSLCLEGVEMCLKNSGAVLLDPDGECLQAVRVSDLCIFKIQNEELYVKVIFKDFTYLDEDQRYNHLKYIRDNLYSRCQVQCTGKQKNAPAHAFLSALKMLKCLGPGNSIKPVCDFCDHTQYIFHINKKLYNFLPERFITKDEEERKWLDFFKGIGLKKSVSGQEFMQLVDLVIKGQSDIEIMKASSILLKYLFECLEENTGGFQNICTKPFVPVRDLKHLTWIAPAFNAPHRLQLGPGETVDLTHLNGAYCGKKPELVWTVMPVISLLIPEDDPDIGILEVVTTPTLENVVKNIIQISRGPFSNPALFDQASSGTVIHKKGTDLVEVMSKIFEFLQSSMDKLDTKLLNTLRTLACVPVDARMQLGTNVSVLVTPPHVVAADEASQYFPFLHCLPHSLYMYLDTVLDKIGVKRSIDPVHIKTILEMMYKQSNQLSLDINTKKKMHLALRVLYTLLKNNKGTDLPNLSPLYLPDQNGKLCESTSLVYCDNVQYSHKVSEFSRAGLSVFLLPPQLGIQEEEFCSLFPKEVRPECVSKHIKKVRHADPADADMPLVMQLQQTLRMPELVRAIEKVIHHLTGGSDSGQGIHKDLVCILSSVKVQTVHNLSHSLSMTQSAQGVDIGVVKLKYELTEESGQCCLYIESPRQLQVSMATCKLACDAIGDMIIKRLESFSKQQPYDLLLRLKECISTLLMAQRVEDIQEVLQTLNLRLDNGEMSYHDQEPKLGDPVPLSWHHRLDQAPGNIFRPQEWVGYEIDDDNIVFAQIVHPADTSDATSGKLNTNYRIYVAENDVTGTVVSSLLLYKFLRGASPPESSSSSAEQRLVLVAMPSNPRVEMTAHEVMVQLNSELKEVQQLSENEKKRAFRRYFLQWHPDKNPDKVELAEEVYKYLRQQISRMETGLPIQDPLRQPASQNDASEPPPPRWQPYFTEWENRAHRHQQSQRSEESAKAPAGSSSTHQGPPKWQPSVDLSQAKIWICQAEADLEAVRILIGQASTNLGLYCHACFFAYEVVCKAVKGGLMAVCGLREREGVRENLVHQAMALEAEVSKLRGCIVRRVEVMVEYGTVTRLPCPKQPPPTQFFSINHAREAEGHARAVLSAVKSAIQNL